MIGDKSRYYSLNQRPLGILCVMACSQQLRKHDANLCCMADEKRFAVIQLPSLKWPTSVRLSGSHFRLFVAADISDVSNDAVSEFASAALDRGMVYFCAWGRECERFHEDFFTTCALPTQGFAADSSFRLVICISNSEWAYTATRVLRSTEFFI
jgi:hypothetical protein